MSFVAHSIHKDHLLLRDLVMKRLEYGMLEMVIAYELFLLIQIQFVLFHLTGIDFCKSLFIYSLHNSFLKIFGQY